MEDGSAKRRGGRVAEGRMRETDPDVEPGREGAGAESVELYADLCVLPICSQRRRAAQGESETSNSLDILVSDGLDVESDGRDGGDALIQLELVEDGCDNIRAISWCSRGQRPARPPLCASFDGATG